MATILEYLGGIETARGQSQILPLSLQILEYLGGIETWANLPHSANAF